MNTFYHAGKIGDLIYSLPTVEALGGGRIYYGGSKDDFIFVRPLIENQSYVSEFIYCPDVKHVTYDLSEFRNEPYVNNQHLVISHARAQGVEDKVNINDEWLKFHYIYECGRYAIVNVTLRHHDRFFNWPKEIEYLHQVYGKVIFIGLKSEWQAMPHARMQYFEVQDALEAAILIRRARMFSGNESAMLAIRQGLGLPYRVEQSPHHNCTFNPKLGKVLNPVSRKIHKFITKFI